MRIVTLWCAMFAVYRLVVFLEYSVGPCFRAYLDFFRSVLSTDDWFEKVLRTHFHG